MDYGKTECHKAFEDLTCGLLIRRALFKPAPDAAGKPVASFWTRRID